MLLTTSIFYSVDDGAMEAAQVTDTGMGRVDFHDEMMARDSLIVRQTGVAIILATKEEDVMGIKYEGFVL